MTEKKRNRSKQIMPNELEFKILNLVWDGKDNVRDVHEVMLEDGYKPYTSVAASMRNLAHKGLLKENRSAGKAYLYTAKVSREELLCQIAATANGLIGTSSAKLSFVGVDLAAEGTESVTVQP